MMRGRPDSRFTKATQWRVGQRLPQSQLAGRRLRCLVLAKFPEPPGTGGESVLGLPGKKSLNEWQIVFFESHCGVVAPTTNIRALPRLLSRDTQVHCTQPGLNNCGPSADSPRHKFVFTPLQLKCFLKLT